MLMLNTLDFNLTVLYENRPSSAVNVSEKGIPYSRYSTVSSKKQDPHAAKALIHHKWPQHVMLKTRHMLGTSVKSNARTLTTQSLVRHCLPSSLRQILCWISVVSAPSSYFIRWSLISTSCYWGHWKQKYTTANKLFFKVAGTSQGKFIVKRFLNQ